MERFRTMIPVRDVRGELDIYLESCYILFIYDYVRNTLFNHNDFNNKRG